MRFVCVVFDIQTGSPPMTYNGDCEGPMSPFPFPPAFPSEARAPFTY